jgi:YesN/AraC family two-component response regulator
MTEGTEGSATMALIMIVDDDAHIQLALQQIVESVGHRVIEASNGQDAIDLFAEFHPDLVVTDVFMPNTDGIETIRAIRRITPNAKIIAISGGYIGNGWNYMDSVVVLGANLALQKPLTSSQLMSAIDRLLDGAAIGSDTQLAAATAC